jgi:transcriptional regulator with XRE-family HTH domain
MDAASRSPLARYLKKHKMSDAEFARRLGVQDSTVYRWRTGKRRPDIDSANAIERATNGAVPASSWSRRVRKALVSFPIDHQHSPQSS